MNADDREIHMDAVNERFSDKRRNDLETTTAIGEHFTALRKLFLGRAKKDEGFNFYVDTNAVDKGVGSRQARNYIAAYKNILEFGSRIDFHGWSVRKIAQYKPEGL